MPSCSTCTLCYGWGVMAGVLRLDTGDERLRASTLDLIERFVESPGIEAVRLSHLAASRSYRLRHLEHGDPADRLLIATAIEFACPLIHL
jgi:PIN domain nuclease of toxin-antitoxin system